MIAKKKTVATTATTTPSERRHIEGPDPDAVSLESRSGPALSLSLALRTRWLAGRGNRRASDADAAGAAGGDEEVNLTCQKGAGGRELSGCGPRFD